MDFIVVGINHKSAPLEIRELFYLDPAQQDLLLCELKSNPRIMEACVLSTCNRVEIYANALDRESLDLDAVIHLIFRIKKTAPAAQPCHCFYRYFNQEAVRHLFEVVCGLDSLVLGEDQILGQVRTAFENAKRFGMLDRQLNILANLTIRVGKKARQETNIAVGGSSISWAAIAKAEMILEDLKERSVLVMGAGVMSELAVGHIQNKQFKKCYLMNRTHAHVQALADKYGGEVVPFCDIKEVLAQADLCICSASAPHYLLDKDIVERIMPLRGFRPIVFIDISMPRNIDPHVSEIANVRLYEIDDLQEVVDRNMQVRAEAIKEVKDIIEQKVMEYYRKIQNMLPFEGLIAPNAPVHPNEAAI